MLENGGNRVQLDGSFTLVDMLAGREAECQRLDAAIEASATGESAALVLVGDAGVGKTTLLDYAADRVGSGGLLRVRGSELESELAFSGLADLVRPIVDHLGEIPAPQSAALAGALALGPPTGGDRFTVCAATLSLLAAAAEDRPLLVLVDDAQWLDAPSTEALVFAARRLGSEGVVVIVAVRSDADTP
ncbi:MAG: AAA family ATPase, partial [Gaiellaceae bacterium]